MINFKRLCLPIFSLLAVVCLSLALGFWGNHGLSHVMADGDPTEIYFEVNTDSEAAYLISKTNDGMSALVGDNSASGNVARSLDKDDSLVYKFKLNSSVDSGELRMFGTLAKDTNVGINVYWSYDNETYTQLTVNQAGRIYNTGVYSVSLTSSDVFATAGTAFYIKVSAVADGLKLYSMYVGTAAGTVTEETTVINTMTEKHLKYVSNANLEYAYFGTNPVSTEVLNGGYIQYTFDLPDDWKNAKVSFTTVQGTLSMTYVDANSTAVISDATDLQTYLKNNDSNVFSVKVMASGGNCMLKDFTVEKKDEIEEQEEQVVIPELTAAAEVYFTAGSEAETPHLGASTGSLGNVGAEGGNVSGGRAIVNGTNVIYWFKLNADITATEIRMYGRWFDDKNLKVALEYSLDGINWTALTKSAGHAWKVGVLVYPISTENALSGEDNLFALRISSSSDSVSLASLYIGNDKTVGEEGVNLTAGSRDYVRLLTDASLENAYAYNGQFTLMILGGGYVSFTMDLPDAWANASFTYSMLQAGVTLEYIDEISGSGNFIVGDSGNFEKYLIKSTDKAFTLKVSASSNAIMGNMYIAKADATGENYDEEETPFGDGANQNTNIPQNETEIYFTINTDAETPYMFYTEEASFESSHSGIALDDANGERSANLPNARKIAAGEAVVYDFDLADSVTSAVFKFYGSASLSVYVSTDNGENWAQLSRTIAPYQLGYNFINLTEEDALATESNSFRIKFAATSTSYLSEVYIATEEIELDGPIYVTSHTIEMMRYLVKASDNYTYWSNKINPWIFLVGDSKFVEWKFPLAEGVSVDRILATLIKNSNTEVKLYVSTDGENYDLVMEADSMGGNPYQRQVELTESTKAASTIWVKAVSFGGQSFVADIMLCAEEKDATTGSFDVFTSEEAGYTYYISGTRFNHMIEGVDAYREIIYGESMIYKFDFADTTDRARIILHVDGEVKASVSTDAETFVEVYAVYSNMGVNYDQVIDLYDVFENNDANVIYLKLESSDTSGEGANVNVRGISYTIENVPDKENNVPDPESESGSSFDYDESDSNSESTSAPATSEKDSSGKGCFGSIEMTSLWILLLAGIVVIARKKRI